MFEKIPGFRRSVANPPLLPSPPSAATALAWRLTAINVRPSVMLWRAQLSAHIALALSFLWAFSPWLLRDYRWQLGLIGIWLLLALSAVQIWRRRFDAQGTLSLTPSTWCWLDHRGEQKLILKGEVVVWPWLVILPFVGIDSGQKKTLILLSDSLSEDELRRLRVWLRTVLPRTGSGIG